MCLPAEDEEEGPEAIEDKEAGDRGEESDHDTQENPRDKPPIMPQNEELMAEIADSLECLRAWCKS